MTITSCYQNIIRHFSKKIIDSKPSQKTDRYRVEVIQNNGERAWSSPIWVSNWFLRMKNKIFFNRIIFVTILATIMTFIMTFFVTYSNLGFVNNFIIKWMIAWGTAIIVAVPVSLLISPIAQKITNKIIRINS